MPPHAAGSLLAGQAEPPGLLHSRNPGDIAEDRHSPEDTEVTSRREEPGAGKDRDKVSERSARSTHTAQRLGDNEQHHQHQRPSTGNPACHPHTDKVAEHGDRGDITAPSPTKSEWHPLRSPISGVYIVNRTIPTARFSCSLCSIPPYFLRLHSPTTCIIKPGGLAPGRVVRHV